MPLQWRRRGLANDAFSRSMPGITPERLLIFPPYRMFLHAGLPPRSGDKYILSTYLEFTAKPA